MAMAGRQWLGSCAPDNRAHLLVLFSVVSAPLLSWSLSHAMLFCSFPLAPFLVPAPLLCSQEVVPSPVSSFWVEASMSLLEICCLAPKCEWPNLHVLFLFIQHIYCSIKVPEKMKTAKKSMKIITSYTLIKSMLSWWYRHLVHHLDSQIQAYFIFLSLPCLAWHRC